ncbi:cytochrome P450 [Gymnopilus junonius]|uniref:Cytochrome P450 n=1 Tax=Gymnopilus junonius TaxID=109634 RepID=A0A9P5TI24_GYMJU|nr:cytochrome P450 [Gymnopilus junonius]
MNGMDKLALLTTLLAAGFLYFKNKRRSALPFPPGPKKHPLLGNLLDLPKKLEWETYRRWGKEYICSFGPPDSDVIHVSAGSVNLIIVNSFEAATDLFDKRSANYSSRPQFTMVRELMGWNWLMSALIYGDKWREQRRLFQKHFSTTNAELYQNTQLEYVRKALQHLLEEPSDFMGITRQRLDVARVRPQHPKEKRPFVDLAQRAVHSITEASVPGTFWVDVMPWLKYIQSGSRRWLPEEARVWRKLQQDFRQVPYQAALKDMASGKAKPSFASECLETIDDNEDAQRQREVIKDTAAIVFAAGADTSLSGIHTLFAAMLCYPEVQKKAQEELDRVLGGRRLPEFTDEPNMPYISALVKEILRWKPATPIGVPHLASEDDVYNGYYIPKRAVVIGNSWAMLHDEETYPDPSTFNPDRFLTTNKSTGKLELDPTVRDPALMAFGFGRRMCPGRDVALSVIWLTMASVLATFNITKAIDENGKELEPDVQYWSGLIVHPLPFKCTIKPRSKAAEELVKSGADAY